MSKKTLTADSSKVKEPSMLFALLKLGLRATWFVVEVVLVFVLASYLASVILNATLLTTNLAYASLVYMGTMFIVAMIAGRAGYNFLAGALFKVKKSFLNVRDLTIIKYHNKQK